MDPTLDPFSFTGMGGGSDAFNYFSSPGYSTQFAPPVTGPYGDAMVGPNPQASYYSADAYQPPSGEAASYGGSQSQVPGTSGAPRETPSATPGGVSSGSGRGVPNAYPTNPFASLFGSLGGGGGLDDPKRRQIAGLLAAQYGMRMMAPPVNPFQPQQQRPQMPGGLDYNTLLKLMQMQQGQQGQNQQNLFGTSIPLGSFDPTTTRLPMMARGGRPQGPTIIGENGPEIFTPDVPGTIFPNPRTRLAGDVIALPIQPGPQAGPPTLFEAFTGSTQNLPRIAPNPWIPGRLENTIPNIAGPRGYQYGGAINAGQSGMVGEAGPEIFQPNMPGTIAPMRGIGVGAQQDPLAQMRENIRKRMYGVPIMPQGLSPFQRGM